MNVLFTGGSSFTGSWFARELASAGHRVTAVFRRETAAYAEDVRRRRVAWAIEVCRPVHGVSFGDERFLSLVRSERFDLLAHHAADVTNFRSPDFDPFAALQGNARGLPQVLGALADGGCRRVLLTGSVFEGGEGAGSQGLPDFSPYGLSKALTSQVFRYYCGRAGMALGKFVIPGPFGPYEDPRYTAYLMTSWFKGQTPSCNNPSYVRDNIHVSLLAKVYRKFAQDLSDSPGFYKIAPSGYPESQGAFTLRLAAEMRPRLRLPCPVELKRQVDFPEPRVRINTDVPDVQALGWDESAAWDEMARYYAELFRGGA